MNSAAISRKRSGLKAASRKAAGVARNTQTPPTPQQISKWRDVAADLVATLNFQQREAATSVEGPVLVLAGAGSGKTRVLITRMLWHAAHHGVAPHQLCALTFSNRAAREMEDRLKSYAGPGFEQSFLGTFHSLGLRILRAHYEVAGFEKPPEVIDTHGRLALLMGQAGDAFARNQNFDAFELADMVSRLKDRGITPDTCPDDTPFGTRLARIWRGYEKALRKAGQVDFEDLIQIPLRLFSAFPEVRFACQARFTHLLVDEFQDTSQSQLDFLLGLTGDKPRVFVVGDDDQSIYGWRGAEMQNVLQFESHFPGAKLLKLEQNYRSTGHIISASNAVVHKNTTRRVKHVFTDQGLGEPLNHHVADDEKAEQDYVVERIRYMRDRETLDLKQLALLTRTNQQLREWMDLFLVSGIPYFVKGASNLLEFSEVQAVLAYAKVMANPADELALSKVLSFPKRGFPKDLLRLAPRSDVSAMESMRHYCLQVGSSWALAAADVLTAIEKAAEASTAGNFVKSFRRLLEEVKVLDVFEMGSKKRERIEEFLLLFGERERRRPDATLGDHLSGLALDTQMDDNDEFRQGVRLMTVHSAKGLEWDTVFLPICDDDVFPSKPNHTSTGIEEERRLFYVALTRAKRRLFISWPKTKVYYRVVKDVIPTRFLFDIPEACWDGPLGQKHEESKQEFLTDFFSNLKSLFGDTPELTKPESPGLGQTTNL